STGGMHVMRLVALMGLTATLVAAQEPGFEAASVKLNRDPGRPRITYQPGGRLVATGVTLRQLVRNAWRIHDLRLQGGPDWITRDTYDVVATAGRDFPVLADDAPPGPMQLMLQRLLVERFKVSVHREDRVTDVFVVRAGERLGPFLRPSTGACL